MTWLLVALLCVNLASSLYCVWLLFGWRPKQRLYSSNVPMPGSQCGVPTQPIEKKSDTGLVGGVRYFNSEDGIEKNDVKTVGGVRYLTPESERENLEDE